MTNLLKLDHDKYHVSYLFDSPGKLSLFRMFYSQDSSLPYASFRITFLIQHPKSDSILNLSHLLDHLVVIGLINIGDHITHFFICF